jgi:hypothetical protein
MDREAAVIRAEMNQTRVELDRKLGRLESRARDMSPRRYARRHMPDYMLGRTIGVLLTFVGVRMAWRRYQAQRARRARHQALAIAPF